MSLFRDSLRPPPLASDEAVQRYLEMIRAELEPDPLFRRRLRGRVMNLFVASRERLDAPDARGASAMGKLGRACLYASVTLAMSVGGVMAASQASLPGELLYPVKRQIEALRVQALPTRLHDDLAVYVLSERVNELGRLAEAGDWARVASSAGAVGAGYEELVAAGVVDGTPRGLLLKSQLVVLHGLLDNLPPHARAAVERAMNAGAPGLLRSAPPGQVTDGHPGRGDAGNRGAHDGGVGGGDAGSDGHNANANSGKARSSATPKPSNGTRSSSNASGSPAATPSD